jgi:hypothetical protein
MAMALSENIIAQLEASERRAMAELRQRQIEAVLGMASITQVEPRIPSGDEIFRGILEAQQHIPHPIHSPYWERDWYCYCSPTRSQFFDRHSAARVQDDELRMAYNRWEPTPVTLSEDELVHTCYPGDGVCVWANCPNTSRGAEATEVVFDEAKELTSEPEVSKELAVIPKPELEVIEVIPEPKRSRVRQLAVIGALAVTACTFVFDIAAVALRI